MMATIHSILARFVTMVLVLAALLPVAGTSLAGAPATPDAAGPVPATTRADMPSAAARLDESLGQLPLYFVENRGQLDAHVAYYVLGGGTQVYFTPGGLTLALAEPEADESRGRNSGDATDAPRQQWAVKLDFIGANPNARPVGEDRTQAVVSYFTGPRGRAGLRTYAKVAYRDLWPGIDLVYYGQAGRLKYNLVIHPGADPAQIRLRYRGAGDVSLNGAGQMAVSTPLGGFTDDAPVAWQEIDGHRVPVPVAFDLGTAPWPGPGRSHATRPVSGPEQDRSTTHYAIRNLLSANSYQPAAIGESQGFGFTLGAYDRSQQLVIDPAVVAYAGYIGGPAADWGYGIAVDGAGNAYVTGATDSGPDIFPEMGGPGLTYKGNRDAFVAKVNASGTALVYAGYIGGSGYDVGNGIAVDGAGNAYITGYTDSPQDSFPVTGGPGLTYNGGRDAFLAKVSASGATLLYAGYIGGTDDDWGSDIAVDGAGNAYVAGWTVSTEDTFPVTAGPDLTHNGGSYDYDAFVAKVSASGATLVYAGYIGGSAADWGYGIAVDGAGNAYIAGWTYSAQDSFPVIGGPDLTYNGNRDAFVAKVNASGTALVYAGYIGGSAGDWGSDIAVDGAGNAYVTGTTSSLEGTFPVIGGPDLSYNGAYTDAFVAEVSASGATLLYAGYIGGSNEDWGSDIAVDGSGNAYVTGWTVPTQGILPVTGGPDLTHNSSFYNQDAFVAKVSASGATLVYASYMGGPAADWGYGIAVDGAGNAYIAGATYSAQDNFPVAGGPDLTYHGAYDAFVAKVFEVRSAAHLPLVVRGN